MAAALPAVVAEGDDLKSRPEVRAMLTVSRAGVAGGPLSETLDRIATEATRVVPGADRSCIILVEGPERRFRLAGSHGLSERYRRMLTSGAARLRPGEGPSGVAYASAAPVTICDSHADPWLTKWAWRDVVQEEGYRAMLSLPLVLGEQVAGALNLYRNEPGPWPDEQVGLMRFFADHAASAVRTAQLLDERAKEVAALRRVVRSLREQTHEHANRLHAVSGLLALDEIDEAKDLLHVLESAQSAIREALDLRVHVPTVAGLVLAEAIVAGQRGIELSLDETSRLRRLPAALSDAQAVTILGNLLDNAFDAVADMPPLRRRVHLRIDDHGGRMVIEVSDCGAGLPPEEIALFERGVTMKPGHRGLGLALVHEAVTAAMGTVEVERRPDGTTFRMVIDG